MPVCSAKKTALSTPIKKTESSKVLSINPLGKGKKPDEPSKVLEYKEVKEKSELNALSNPGKGKSTDPSKVHDRDPSPSSSDKYNQPHSTPIKVTESSKGEYDLQQFMMTTQFES
ncbi:uncharacterized protein LOC125570191 isoform X2 [Nematostella vectensis]|uniref:uncharacterized protein LOC125570191 isoform X2 n=1 Tax=Nematostella vectensis TaxID=45351 RepID=UPI002076FA99|nr:uncharacterized protein LOC125570191 isoform X2 [Nematostella vectensis]